MINKFFDMIHFKEDTLLPNWLNKLIRWFRVYFPDMIFYGINYIILSAIILAIYHRFGFEYVIIMCFIMLLIRISKLSKEIIKSKSNQKR